MLPHKASPEDASILPRTKDRYDDEEKPSSFATPTARRGGNRDKIRCLDGLRGIACLLVFNYHFLWPWTPAIMLGYGALPPRAPEPYESWISYPILCLLNRGRPMVAIFFAISGYVLCRHILRAIHEKRVEAAYQALSSSVFRRAFRLYLPPTISMAIVAVLAQTGAFRSEFAVYKGPDSKYINGTVTVGKILREHHECANGTVMVTGPMGVAEYLNVPDPAILANASDWEGQHVCVNSTNRAFSPALLYTIPDPEKRYKANKTAIKLGLEEDLTEDYAAVEEAFYDKLMGIKKSQNQIKTLTNSTRGRTQRIEQELKWVQFGGSWEEHPFIHPNLTYAAQNFTRSYAEWANPFNYGHYHPRYDPHTFTIPMELRGSMLLYVFLLGTAALQYKWRHRLACFLSAYSIFIGRWDMGIFMGGMVLSERDIRSAEDEPRRDGSMIPIAPRGRTGAGFWKSPAGRRLSRWMTIVLALYLLSYPDSGAEYTPGYVFLATWFPKYYIPLSGWMFYQAIGALLLLPCILRSPALVSMLESPLAQYMGKISFSFYLIHGPVLHCLGFWVMPRLFDRFGQGLMAYAVGYIMLLGLSLWLSNIWCRKVDGWSVGVGKRVEKFMMEGI